MTPEQIETEIKICRNLGSNVTFEEAVILALADQLAAAEAQLATLQAGEVWIPEPTEDEAWELCPSGYNPRHIIAWARSHAKAPKPALQADEVVVPVGAVQIALTYLMKVPMKPTSEEHTRREQLIAALRASQGGKA